MNAGLTVSQRRVLSSTSWVPHRATLCAALLILLASAHFSFAETQTPPLPSPASNAAIASPVSPEPGAPLPETTSVMPVTESPPGETAPAPEEALTDAPAQLFMQKCAGCHTIGGGALTGPDLKAAQQWPETNLIPAIQRMEKNVGPLKPEVVKLLTGLILAPDAASRLAEERKRITLSQAAKLAPASATTGEALFFGRQPLANGGLACSACHAVNGRGGNLAIDLTPSFTKLGAIPLGSTIENVTFPLMQVAYLQGPSTQQETVHLVKSLESVSTSPATPQGLPPVHVLGTMGAVAVVGVMGFLYKDRNRGVRAALVRDAIRRNR